MLPLLQRCWRLARLHRGPVDVAGSLPISGVDLRLLVRGGRRVVDDVEDRPLSALEALLSSPLLGLFGRGVLGVRPLVYLGDAPVLGLLGEIHEAADLRHLGVTLAQYLAWTSHSLSSLYGT
jgi:hypothetical protein